MSAVSIPSRKMPWQTKAQRGTVMAALAIKKEIVKARLIQLREDVGHPDKPGKPLTVEDAAAKAGVKYRTWQRWEAGESVPYARNLAAIADAFGFDVGEFYDAGDKAETPDPFAGRGDGDRLDRLERLVERHAAILERIEDAIARDQQARAALDESAERLQSAVAAASRVLRAETQSPAAAPERPAK